MKKSSILFATCACVSLFAAPMLACDKAGAKAETHEHKGKHCTCGEKEKCSCKEGEKECKDKACKEEK
jgi:hypothetical protein